MIKALQLIACYLAIFVTIYSATDYNPYVKTIGLLTVATLSIITLIKGNNRNGK